MTVRGTSRDRKVRAGEGACPEPAPGGGRRRLAGRGAWLAAVLVVVAALFLLYWRQARSASVSSDGASIIMQASDMLHGNLLLHGWITSDVSFYGTELVQYMLLQSVLPMSPSLVFVAGAMTYTILVVLAGYLARGRATGREGLLRACLGGGIMVAPALGDFTATLLHAPNHIGSAVPVLLVFCVIDRCRARWYVPVAVCLLLTWGQVADPLIAITGAAAIVVACGARSGYRALRRNRHGRTADGNLTYSETADGSPADRNPGWFEPVLAVAALVSIGLARLALAAIHAAGGFTAAPVNTGFMGLPGIWRHAAITVKGVLGLFGAAFWTQVPEKTPAYQVLFDCLHLAGAALAAVAFAVALWRFFRRADPVSACLATAIVLNLAAFMTSKYAGDLLSIREAAAVLPLGAALAGRVLSGPLLAGRPLVRRRLVPVLAALGAGYLAALVVNAAVARPAAPAQASLAERLAARHLTSGLAAGYWLSNIVTVDSHGAVRARNVQLKNGTVARPDDGWETAAQWYDPAQADADFLATDARPGSATWTAQLRAAERSFGRPARTYRWGEYTVFTWNRNILRNLPPARGT